MKLRKRKLPIKRLLLFAGIALFIIMIFPVTTGAWWWEEDTTDIVAFLQSHSNWLSSASLLSWIIRSLGWLLIKGLYAIASTLEGLLSKSLDLLDWLDLSGLSDLAQGIITGVVVGIFAITLIWLAIKMIIGKEAPAFKSIFVNIIICGILIAGLPSVMGIMEDIAVAFYNDSQSTGNDVNGGMSWTLIKDNTVDLVYVAENGWDLIANDTSTTDAKSALTAEDLKILDMNTVLTTDAIDDSKVDDENFKHLKYYIDKGADENLTAYKFSDGGIFSFFSNMFDSGYYRYNANFWTIIIGLIALIVAYAFTIFVFVTTIIELGIKRVVAPLVFATDIETGQRTKMVIQDIANGYLLIAFTGLMFRIYGIFITYLGTVSIDGLLYLISLVAATFVLIKGSSTILRFFGVDVGLNDGLAQIVGTMGLAKTLFRGKRHRRSKEEPQGADPHAMQDAQNQAGEEAEGSLKRVPRPNHKGVNKPIGSIASKLGYLSERGIKRTAADTLSDTLRKPIEGAVHAAQGVKETAVEGFHAGKDAAANRAPGANVPHKRTSGGSTVDHSGEYPNDDMPLIDLDLQNQRPGQRVESGGENKVDSTRINTVNPGDVNAVDTSRVNKVDSAQQRIQQEGSVTSPTEETLTQRVLQNIETNSPPIQPSTQKIVQEHTPVAGSDNHVVTQRVQQQVEQQTAANIPPTTQRIAQEIINPSEGTTAPLPKNKARERLNKKLNNDDLFK